MAGSVPSQPLLTVLMSARAWLEEAGSGRDVVQLQLSAEPERAGDFRLCVRRSPAGAARGPGGEMIVEFQLRDVSYQQRAPRCHELAAPPGRLLTFHFDDEREAQKWWTVVSSAEREARRVTQSHLDVLGSKPPTAEKPRPLEGDTGESLRATPDLCTKEDVAARLGRCIEAGDQQMAAQYAVELARQKLPVQVQLKPLCYPQSEICMKVGVEDASASVNISTYVAAQTTIAALKQQIFREYQFHPSIQRWIIGRCLCSDDRTVASYGVRKDGDTAFLYLLGAKQAKLADPSAGSMYLPAPPAPGRDERPKFSTMPARPGPRNGVSQSSRAEKMEPHNLHLELLTLSPKPPLPAAPPSPAQPGWPCPQCTFINKPTRPGCEMCSADRPADYVVPDEYKPDETELRRLQLEKDSYQQYAKGKGRREAAPPPQHKPSADSLDDFTVLL